MIGCHVSIAGGFDKCIDRAIERGAECLMTFASSPRTLQTKEYSQSEVDGYLNKKLLYQCGPHFFHAPYLINLASQDPDYLQASERVLNFYQFFANKIGSMGTIVHIGSHAGQGFSNIKQTVIKSIVRVATQTPSVNIYLELCAGESGKIGTLDELAELIHATSNTHPNIKICLDTQHAFAAGLELATLVDRFEEKVGLKHLGVIHFNDSKTEYNSHVDRHANIGEGKIGIPTLQALLNNPRLKSIPFILEVPGAGDGPRKEDVDTVKSLRDNIGN